VVVKFVDFQEVFANFSRFLGTKTRKTAIFTKSSTTVCAPRKSITKITAFESARLPYSTGKITAARITCAAYNC